MPALIRTTLKLMRRPRRLSASFKWVRSYFLLLARRSLKAGINTNRIVDDRDGLLPEDTQFTLFQFVGQRRLVDRFQQTRPESSMHAKGCIDDLARLSISSRQD